MDIVRQEVLVPEPEHSSAGVLTQARPVHGKSTVAVRSATHSLSH